LPKQWNDLTAQQRKQFCHYAQIVIEPMSENDVLEDAQEKDE